MASLYDRLGGRQAISLVVDKFYDLMLMDKRVSAFFEKTDMKKQRQSQKQFITMVCGGPNQYHGQDMKCGHQGMGIGKFQFDATWENLQKALNHYKVPQQEIKDLKEVFYSVQDEIIETSAKSNNTATLYDRLGGRQAISLVVDKFYDLMLMDKRVSAFFEKTDMKKQRQSQKQFITMVCGGPNQYHGQDMKCGHQGMGIGKFQFDATWENLQKALNHYKVPQQEIKDLKEVFYSVQDQIIQNHQSSKTLFQSLGGSQAISLVVRKFYEQMLKDDRVKYYFTNTDMQKQINSQIKFITMVTGGPQQYKGKDMITAHCPYKISQFEFDATWENLNKALDFYNVPANLANQLKEVFYSVEGEVVNCPANKKPQSPKKCPFDMSLLQKNFQQQSIAKQSPQQQKQQSLYQRLGGSNALRLVVNRFYDLVLEDPRINFYFSNTDMAKQRNSQTEFLSMVTGGPALYNGKDMKAAHCPYRINESEFDITWQCLKRALKEYKVGNGLIKQVKEIFYSVEGDIVRDKVTGLRSSSFTPQHSSQYQPIPVTLTRNSQQPQLQHPSSSSPQGARQSSQKLSQHEKRQVKQQFVSNEAQTKPMPKKLRNNPYQRTYY